LKQWYLGPDTQQQTVRLKTMNEEELVDIQVAQMGMVVSRTNPVDV
jgi:hypothetical protein